MMVPTNRLRWIWVNDHKEAGVVYVNPPRHMVLQQWWSLSGAGPEFIAQLNYPPDHEGWGDLGEWRDVEIVEE